jgi:hypothetical protein
MRVNTSLTEENAERFKTLGGSKWLNRILSDGKAIIVLTEQDRMQIIEAVSASRLDQSQKDALLKKLVG